MHIASLKDVVSVAEWQLRCDLAACYRLVRCRSTFVLGSLAYHGYEGVAFRDEEKPRKAERADPGYKN